MTSETNPDAETDSAYDAGGAVDTDEATGIAEITLEDGGLVVYDRANTDAWLQSETTLALESMA